MPMTPEVSLDTAAYLDSLRRLPESAAVAFIIACHRKCLTLETGESDLVVIDAPELPSRYDGLVSTEFGITVPGNMAVFRCSASAATAIELFTDRTVRVDLLGSNWQQACASGSPHVDYIVQVDGQQLCLDGEDYRTRFSLATVPPGSPIHGYFKPSRDEDADEVAVPDAVLRRLPEAPVRDTPELRELGECHHAFFFTNCTVDTAGLRAVRLADNVLWWAPQAYPSLGRVAAELKVRSPEGTSGRPLSGIITVAFPPTLELEAYREHFRTALEQVKRLRTLA